MEAITERALLWEEKLVATLELK